MSNRREGTDQHLEGNGMIHYMVSIGLFLLAGTYLFATFRLPILKSTDPMGPRVFPLLLGIALALGALLLLTETIRAKNQKKMLLMQKNILKSAELHLRLQKIH